MTSEWSHPVLVEKIEDRPLRLEISPDAEQAAALARRFGVSAIKEAKAKMSLSREGLKIHVEGKLNATVVQPCAVTLEPVETKIEEEFEAWFADREAAVSIANVRRERDMKKGNLELPMLEESEDPEPVVDGKIDLGELAAQYLSLSINPYVHADGAIHDYIAPEGAGQASEARKNPFAALAEWKDKLK